MAVLQRVLFLSLAVSFGAPLTAQQPAAADNSALLTDGRRLFATRCAGCHGADGTGGERAPGIGRSEESHVGSEQSIRDVITKGIPESGMPAFSVSGKDMDALVLFVHSRVTPAEKVPVEGDAKRGEAFFSGEGRCMQCHMVKGCGGTDGPDLTELARHSTLAEIEQSLRAQGTRRLPGFGVVRVRLNDGSTVRGLARNESGADLQIKELGAGFRLLQRSDIAHVEREPQPLMPPLKTSAENTKDLLAFLSKLSPATLTRPPCQAEPLPGAIPFSAITRPERGEWPTYHGVLSGNRHSPLTAITPANVGRLAPAWVFPMQSRHLEGTPVVVGGVMYFTSVNEVIAVDPQAGRSLWRYARPRTKGVIGDAGGGINRGIAILGDRVFVVTDDAHVLALHRLTGGLLWDSEMADFKRHYGATSAPLVIKDLVISGTSGGDEGASGLITAFRADTGERVWQFHTLPTRDEPHASTWQGRALEHGCGTAWLTGTYDAELDLLYWTTGNPCPDYNGDERKGDNLYTDSVLALKPATGELKWYFQFTPHDLHDWDAAQTPMLVDAEFRGKPRKLMLQGNRNGFFYVLDRTTGEFLRATPLVRKITWASGIGDDGTPKLFPGSEPTIEGTKACPSVEGATNWMSTAYDSVRKLFFVQTLESCNIYTKSSAWWKQGESFYGGATRDVPGEPGEKQIRAISLETGQAVWEYPLAGRGTSWGGILSTASGLVFYCDNTGGFAALDANSGKPLWHFQTNGAMKASPMTYLAGGKQYVAIAAGSNIFSFTLPD
jgi:alcohol dehydrogenase (cytochrome c)